MLAENYNKAKAEFDATFQTVTEKMKLYIQHAQRAEVKINMKEKPNAHANTEVVM